MASVTRHGKGWRASVKVKGARDTQVFRLKSEADAWAVDRERELRKGPSANAGKPLQAALTRYAEEVSAMKRGARWERLRLNLFGKMEIAGKRLEDIKRADIAGWRDARLKEVSASTVRREMNLLGHVFAMACGEWQWLAENPTKGVKRPEDSPKRDRRITDDEIAAILISTGYDPKIEPLQASCRVGAAFLFAIETGMRAGEICGIHPEHVRDKAVHLPHTKNGYARDVPLSPEAQRIMRQVQALGLRPVFGLKSSSLDALFRKARDQASIAGLHFHDTRHEAVSRLCTKLDVLALARMIGHRDLKMLLRYYSDSADKIAERL